MNLYAIIFSIYYNWLQINFHSGVLKPPENKSITVITGENRRVVNENAAGCSRKGRSSNQNYLLSALFEMRAKSN
ncbi:hypothetical protein QE152_g28379 [Popillia japonica]|uniref:Uncharacterized protein n=1 Tax=Popillia japonica TaxID=7064 RepID=A0AAW1JMD4_POPJA